MSAVMSLDAHRAEVSTATVQVKTLTISGKQVTLAVFRQLMNEPLINLVTGELNGKPWGIVNYPLTECKDKPSHLHVVWQREHELMRSCVHKTAPWQGTEAAECVHYAGERMAISLAYKRELDQNLITRRWGHSGDFMLAVSSCGINFEIELPKSHGYYNHSDFQFSGTPSDNDWKEEERKKRLLELDSESIAQSSQELIDTFNGAAREVREFIDQYNDSYSQIESLDQLFIAV